MVLCRFPIRDLLSIVAVYPLVYICKVDAKLLDPFKFLLYREVIDLFSYCFIISRKGSFLFKIEVSLAGRHFQDASFDIPQAILEDLYSTLLIKQGVHIMRVVRFTPVNLAQILEMILNALWFG